MEGDFETASLSGQILHKFEDFESVGVVK